uniref:Uncharacterized protein n=1 Tax=Leersia perrieri TaxID=77586 RepID=A0A0D9VSH1_9ORYZ
MLSGKGTSRVNWVAASAMHVLVIAFVIVVGFLHAKTSNLTPFMPYGVPGVFRAAAIVYLAYGGFDNIATMAEETKNPSRDIPLGPARLHVGDHAASELTRAVDWSGHTHERTQLSGSE